MKEQYLAPEAKFLSFVPREKLANIAITIDTLERFGIQAPISGDNNLEGNPY